MTPKKRPPLSDALRSTVEAEPSPVASPVIAPRIRPVNTTATFTPEQHRRLRLWMAERDGMTLKAVLAALVDELTTADSTNGGLAESVERRVRQAQTW